MQGVPLLVPVLQGYKPKPFMKASSLLRETRAQRLTNDMPDCVALVCDAFYLAFQGSTSVTGKSRVTQLRERPADFLQHLIADVLQSFFTPKSHKGIHLHSNHWAHLLGKGSQAHSKRGSLSMCPLGVITGREQHLTNPTRPQLWCLLQVSHASLLLLFGRQVAALRLAPVTWDSALLTAPFNQEGTVALGS